jgi:hypothetical protein
MKKAIAQETLATLATLVESGAARRGSFACCATARPGAWNCASTPDGCRCARDVNRSGIGVR